MVEVEDYKLLAPLGTGISGQVYVAEKKDDHKLYALKFIDRFYKDQQQEQNVIMMLEQEVNAIEMVDSDRVVKSTECFTTENFFVIVMDYCQNGDLFNYVKAKGFLEESEAIDLFAQILDGIKAVHSINLIHRDIKPENILLDDNFSIKIGDFGASIFYNKDNILDNVCGTYYYMAPELENYEEYDFSVDLWGIGCVLFFMLTGNSPFSYCTSQLQISNCIQEFCNPQLDIDCLLKEHVERKTLKEDHKITISNEVKDLISKILKVKPQDRICFSDILKHPALKKYKALPSVKNLIIQQKDYTQIYQSQISMTKLQLTNMKSIKKHDFSPQKSKQLLLNTSYNNIPSLIQLNSANNSSDKKFQVTFQEIDEILLTNRQDSSCHQIPLIRKESEFFFNKPDLKSTKQKINLVDTQTPSCKILLTNMPKSQTSPQTNNQDISQSAFSIDSDEYLEEDESISKRIQQYNHNCNIMIIKNKISNDPNSPSYRGLNPDLTLSFSGDANTPISKTVQKSPLSQFSDISPINVNNIK